MRTVPSNKPAPKTDIVEDSWMFLLRSWEFKPSKNDTINIAIAISPIKISSMMSSLD